MSLILLHFGDGVGTLTFNNPAKRNALSNALLREMLAPETFERVQGLRRKAYDSEDYVEGKRAFLEKRKPVFHGR